MNLLLKRHLLIILALTISLPLFSQQKLVDSVLNQLKQNLPDSTRLLSMVRLAMYYEPVDANTAHKKYQEARQLAEKKNLPLYKGLSYRYEATLYMFHLQYAEKLRNLDSAAAVYATLSDKKALSELASTYMDYGTYYTDKNDEKKAAEYYFKAADIQEKNGFKVGLLPTYINLSTLFQRMGQMEEQKDYTDRSLILAKTLNKPKYLFIGYLFEANYYAAKQIPKKTLLYLDSAKKYISYSNEVNVIQSYYNLHANAYEGLKQYDSVIYYLKVSYESAIKNNLSWYKMEAELKLGYNYLLQKKYTISERYLTNALKSAIADSIVLFQKEGYESLSRLYAETNQYKKAYDYYKIFHSLTDSLVGTEKKKFTLDLQNKYETEKKEQEIKSLLAQQKIQQLEIKQKNTLNYTLISGSIVLLLLGGLLYINYGQKQSLQQQRISDLEKESHLTATEAVLRGEEQERTRLARDLHDGLSGMLSGAKFSLLTMQGNLVMTPDNQQSFERGMDMLDNSILEMRRVAQNMMPEALIHFGLNTALKDYCNEINKNSVLKVIYQSMGMENTAIPQSTSIAIYRIVQELLNNVIKHAAASQVLVQLFHEKNKLIINVEDDGKGFNKAILENSNRMGWKNIQSRIEYLKGKSDIQSSPGKGTFINIELNMGI